MNENPHSLYSPDVGRCRICGTTRTGKYLTGGACNDDWHARLEALKGPTPPKPRRPVVRTG